MQKRWKSSASSVSFSLLIIANEVSDISTNIVRETLSEDLIERFIIDILEITEQLSSKPLKKY